MLKQTYLTIGSISGMAVTKDRRSRGGLDLGQFCFEETILRQIWHFMTKDAKLLIPFLKLCNVSIKCNSWQYIDISATFIYFYICKYASSVSWNLETLK